MFGSRDEFNSTDPAARSRQMSIMRQKALSMLDPHLQDMVHSSNAQNAEHLTGLRNHYDDGGTVSFAPNTGGQETGQQMQSATNMNTAAPATSQYLQNSMQSTQNPIQTPAISMQNNQPYLPKY